MKLLDKIKNAIFEDEEFDEEFSGSNEKEKEVKEEPKKEEVKTSVSDIVKKIDIEKTIPKNIEIKKEVSVQAPVQEEKPIMKREMRRTPVIFDDEDFEVAEKKEVRREPVIKEEVKKPLYGGYKDEKTKEKFKPSPIISPVYGFVGVSPILEHSRNDDLAEKHIFIQNKKEEISLDAVRQKAFGDKEDTFMEDDDLGLLYEMKKEEDTPAISKITLGDAEEYFEDLGLEYNVDYRDESRKKEAKSTRSTKNKELSEKVDNEILKELESTRELEITKEQLKPKTAKEIKKVKKIDDIDLGMTDDKDDAEEKNLYDLIDMMYDSK